VKSVVTFIEDASLSNISSAPIMLLAQLLIVTHHIAVLAMFISTQVLAIARSGLLSANA